ncbi:MAG: GerMN domain-containing protein [Treponema sp.]|jgi:hypothetical protein|nr:GerMN domain-containing protein [Treponema sp.]
MNLVKNARDSLSRFFGKKRNRRLCYLVLIGIFALGDFFISGLVRRTFVFYSNIEGTAVVEDRMLRRSSSRETDINRYVDEVLLGPVSPDSAPLFPSGTRLESFMYRDGIVYADLSESALFPPGGADLFRNFLVLNEGIRRNFSFVEGVKIFIGGKEVFFNEFREIF